MTTRTHAEAQLQRLKAAFPNAKMGTDTFALYLDEMAKMDADSLGNAVQRCIDKCKYFPRIAELTGAGARKRDGADAHCWPKDTRAFMDRAEAAERRGDHVEVAFLRHVTDAWHRARIANRTGIRDDALVDELNSLGLNESGRPINGRPFTELAVPTGYTPMVSCHSTHPPLRRVEFRHKRWDPSRALTSTDEAPRQPAQFSESAIAFDDEPWGS